MNKAGEVKFEGSLSSPKDSREEVRKGQQKNSSLPDTGSVQLVFATALESKAGYLFFKEKMRVLIKNLAM